MKQKDKLERIKKHIETMKKSIGNINNLSSEELKDYTKIVIQLKTQFYPEIYQMLSESLEMINEVLNETKHQAKLSATDFR